ncbi:MAG: hypothetical protein AAGF85_10225 [Bacteroidota bacterium]
MSSYKLKLKSKRLKSGKCQIQFFVRSGNIDTYYGYLLAESGTTLKEVVGRIESKVRVAVDSGYKNSHLLNLNERHRAIENVLLFNYRS